MAILADYFVVAEPEPDRIVGHARSVKEGYRFVLGLRRVGIGIRVRVDALTRVTAMFVR